MRRSRRRTRRPVEHRFRPSAEPLEGRELLTGGGGTLTSFTGPFDFASSVATGTDGNLYVASAGDGSLTALSPDGTPLATYRLPGVQPPDLAVAAGSDGGIWVAGETKLTRLDRDGTIASYGLSQGSYVRTSSIVAGADGSAWFIDGGTGHFNFTGPDLGFTGPDLGWVVDSPPSIGHITPDGTETFVPVTDGTPSSLAAGPNGSFDFSLIKPDGSQAIGQINDDGTLGGEIALPAGLNPILGLTTGPDGNLWFLSDDAFSFVNAPSTAPNPMIGRVTPSGDVSTFAFTSPTDGTGALSPPGGLISAPDGNLYFTDNGEIDQVTMDGKVTETAVPLSYNRGGDAIGPDGNLWIAISDAPWNQGVAVYSLGGTDPGTAQAPPPVLPPASSNPPPVPIPVDPTTFPDWFSGPDILAPMPIAVASPFAVASPAPTSILVGVAVLSPVATPTIAPASAITSSASPSPTKATAAPVEVVRAPATVPAVSKATALSASPSSSSTGTTPPIPLEIAAVVPTVDLDIAGLGAPAVVGHRLGRPAGLTRVVDPSRAGA